jgi:D-alanine-D-alanine ligase-like ATP-grasp enzyme
VSSGPVVVLVDPSASGTSLSEAISERGGVPLHVWHQELAERHAADPTRHKLLHTDLARTTRALLDAAPVAVLAGSEYGVTLTNQLAMALSLPHNDPALATARRDKQAMLQVVEAAGLAVPHSYLVSEEAELEQVLAKLARYPVMVKPKDSAGSDGCAMCHDADEVAAAFRSLKGVVNYMRVENTEILVQEFIDGPQYIVDTVSVDGRHYLTDVFRYRIDNLAGKPVIRDSILRIELTAEERAAVEYVFSCLTALGIRNWAAHSEVRITASGPVLIEVNSRLMGPLLPADPFVASLGYSQATVLADAALDRLSFGSPEAFGYAPRRTLGHLMLRAWQGGVITAMPGLDVIRRLPGFHSMIRLPSVGTRLSPENPLTNATTGVAYFISEDEEVVLRSMEAAHELEDTHQIFSLV